MKKTILLLLVLPSLLFSQQRKIDSLLTILKRDKADTNRVNHLVDLCNFYRLVGLYDTALYYGNSGLKLAQLLNFEKGVGNAYNNISIVYKKEGNYAIALDYQLKALKIQQKFADKKGIARSYNNIGILYKVQGNYPPALEYYLKSLKLRGEIGDTDGMAASYNNIGLIYFVQNNDSLALKNYLLALHFFSASGNRQSVSTTYSNIGGLYEGERKFDAALENDWKSLAICQEMGDREGIARAYDNIGSVYKDDGNYPLSLENYNKSLEIKEKIGDKGGLVICYNNIGKVYLAMKQLQKAIEFADKGLDMSKKIGSKDDIKDAYLLLSDAYFQMNDFKKAYDNYKSYTVYLDSLTNEENTKRNIRTQMTFDFEKKSSADSVKNAEQQKLKDAQNHARLEQEKTQRYALYGGVIILLVFGGFMFNRFRVTQKQKNIIEIKNRETEEQKNIIEEKQKEIVDSINYARRIQYTLLAQEQLLKENLNGHFVLFKPKDIVSGDFYWATEVKKNNLFYLACCDSTGHGVPGAFMSLLNISFLNEAIIEKNILEPHEVLNHVRKRLIENISQSRDDSGGGQDGMDAILICIDKTKNTIRYSAANNSPVLIQDGEVKNLPCDKMPVGKGEKDMPFTLQTIDFKKGDSLYLFTDGYADQFGGPKGKKFKYKQLNEKLLSISDEEITGQKTILESVFEKWRGNVEQVDDVLVIGIKV